MKKIILAAAAVGLLATSAYAGDLANSLQATTLSTNVSGVYYTDTGQSHFLIGTYNSKGSKYYATGDFTSNIYVDDCAAAGACTTTDIPADPGTAAASYDEEATTDPFSGMTVLGASSSS